MDGEAKQGAAAVVPELVLRGIEHARGKGLDLSDVPAVRAACRRKGFYYASAWIGNHRAEYARGVAGGFVAEEPDEWAEVED